ncbi:hypothetical protein ASPCAL05241 [Aspergillus calidoustus]|uniref:AMP-dependent synthetase/ligase domain-containing protein n=1 Tax=Aspergillus calidoustus TaxID=454130 RepID=A0A0U5FZL7_ASPCI|nr:hypothetical protein ASPCAL05241 [Aspergillus calidoustus]
MLGIDLFTFSPSPATEYANAQFTLMHEPNSDPSKPPFNPARCFALLYTSGTTGPPKGALYTCNNLVLGTKSYLDRLSLSTTDTWLHQMPAHWKGGFDFILAAAYAGACLEFCSAVFSPTWFWERMRRGGITAMVASPATLSGLKEQLDLIESRQEREECIRGLNEIRALSTGSMAVPDSVKDIWRKLRGGRPLVIMYGFTEAAGMMAMTDWRDIETRESSSGNCGTLAPGMEAKVNECGEICFKGPLLMKRYVSAQENVMSNVFDESGFYKSGDLGSISANGEVSIHGRANQDVIRSLGWKINALEVEDALRDHPSISNVFILGVADTEAGQRIAALIVRKRAVGTKSQNDFRLVALRKYLAVEKQLPAFKLPTLLRVIPHGQTLPTSDSGKPSKKKMEGVYFGSESVESGDVEVWDFKTKEDFPERPWDWEGRPPA